MRRFFKITISIFFIIFFGTIYYNFSQSYYEFEEMFNYDHGGSKRILLQGVALIIFFIISLWYIFKSNNKEK